jgi:hypothetical protein
LKLQELISVQKKTSPHFGGKNLLSLFEIFRKNSRLSILVFLAILGIKTIGTSDFKEAMVVMRLLQIEETKIKIRKAGICICLACFDLRQLITKI